MVLLINTSINLPKKSDKKLADFESNALKSFQSYLSVGLNDLLGDEKHGSSSFSLSWYIPCFKFLQGINRAFAKLVKDLNYPVEIWKEKLTEDYLSFTLNLLDALNSISSSISHLGISKLSLIHAVSLIHDSPSLALEHLKPIKPRRIQGELCKKMCSRSFNCDKERVVFEALMKIKEIELVILRVLLNGLSDVIGGDLGLLNCVEFEGFNLRYCEGLMVEEIVKTNEAVKEIGECLIEGKKSSKMEVAVEELKKMLGKLETSLELVNKEVNWLFSDVLARRSGLIDCLKKQ